MKQPAGRVTTQKLKLGYNEERISRAIELFENRPVGENSDELRTLRFLEPRLDNNGRIELIGKSLSPDIADRKTENIYILTKESEDIDQFCALQKLVNNLIIQDKLASSMSIHNFTGLAGHTSGDTVVYCGWPVPKKGFKAHHVIKYWMEFVKQCRYLPSGERREQPLKCI